MNKSELESKHLSELHALAAEAGVERYRMLPRAELIEQLAGGGNGSSKPKAERGGREAGRRKRGGGGDRSRGGGDRQPGERRERKPREERKPRREPKREPREEKPQAVEATPAAPPERPKRKRRRRRWGRRRKGGVRVHDLLLPPSAGHRAIVYAEDRAACTALLRELASELAGEANGPDPIALLIDPSPEELADWKREAPQAEIVSAGQARHADDALAQAGRRAGAGEDVIVLIDSLTRYAEDFAGPEQARDLFDSGLDVSGGTLTVLAALERT